MIVDLILPLQSLFSGLNYTLASGMDDITGFVCWNTHNKALVTTTFSYYIKNLIEYSLLQTVAEFEVVTRLWSQFY